MADQGSRVCCLVFMLVKILSLLNLIFVLNCLSVFFVFVKDIHLESFMPTMNTSVPMSIEQHPMSR